MTAKTKISPQLALSRAFAAQLPGGGTLDTPQQAFVEQVAEDVVADELPGVSEAALARALAEFWAFGGKAKAGKSAIRIVPLTGETGEPLGLDRLEIVQDDRPFLVASVMGEVAEQGLPVRAMFHPVVDLGQGPRSMILVVLETLGSERAKRLTAGIEATLADVRVAVEDFPAILELAGRVIGELQAAPDGDSAQRNEELAFLRWMEDGHFVYLGARQYDYPRSKDGGYAAEEPLYQPQGSLGVLRDQQRTVLRRANEPAILSKKLEHLLKTGPVVTAAKSNLRSRVHRRGYMDYIGVRRFGPDGKPSGEVRFVGLFTADAYDEPAHAVPLIRRKIAGVLDDAGEAPGSHNFKRLKNILEAHPRDELFQMTEKELLETAQGILHLYDRPRVRVFARRDPFDRFISALLFVPRERYDSDLRERAGEILAEAYGGRVSAYYPAFPEAALARVHFIIGVEPGHHKEARIPEVEARIALAARTWQDRLETALRERAGDDAGAARLEEAFTAGYREAYDAEEALADLSVIDGMAEGEAIRVRAFRSAADNSITMRFKLYRPDEPAPLAEVLPILERMGLKAMFERGFPVSPGGGRITWIHEFVLQDERGEHLVFGDLKTSFEETMVAVWTGRTESDGFNRLVLELGISWRWAALVRALARYRQQSGLDPSQAVQEQALADHAEITRLILDLFRIRFDPAISASMAARGEQAAAVMGQITEALQEVESLDDDRVLRRLAALVQAVQRTNFYQTGEDGQPQPHISFKVASQQLADLPAPKPYREIFVSANHVEGVHLRFGPVARGGLRWSDRRDDFRTEVLALAKAQNTKNAVIVPLGSKGGFYPKQLPKGGAPDAVRAEGVRAYTTFLNGLLDLTDNIGADGGILPPPDVVRHDGDDPYLVVAADKGTATFSDIANGIAEARGFWLGDAFASGGSAGYDHKVMGITARGAWEAVKRHFRELGKDIQAEPFTVIGVGDMSGDVFGNGMLLSKQTRLLAAFDHRHIFLDPDPDPATSWDERARMFALPRSSWDDYDRKLISKGGGVFARSLKSIPLSPEVRAWLGVAAEAMAPVELIHAILQAEAELLYLGGIGTYVKAKTESHADVGDKTNDGTRVSAGQLKVKVVGEGANLGLTQAGRVEFALAGGRINTDAVDNSAGVDSSDHEVNIKILTGMAEREGKLTRKRRDPLLASMTDEVAEKVLAHNYDQTLAISLMRMDAAGELDAYARYMLELESDGRLERAVEGLPDPLAISERAKAGLGLMRPELAVVMAYAKNDAFAQVIAGQAPDDPAFEDVLEGYFPGPLRRYEAQMRRHRLRREIIATVLVNDLINRAGATFPSRLHASTGCNRSALIVAFAAAKRILDFDAIWEAVEALDGKIAAGGQMALFRALAHSLRGMIYWFAKQAAQEHLTVGGLVARYGKGVDQLRKLIPGVLSPVEQAGLEKRLSRLVEAGAPQDLALRVAVLQPVTTASNLVDLAEGSSWALPEVARLYHQTASAFGFDRLRAAAGEFRSGDSFERSAVRRLIEDMLAEQTSLTRAIMAFSGTAHAGRTAEDAKDAVNSWRALRREPADLAAQTLSEIESAPGGWSFAKLTIANAALRELAEAASAKAAKGKK